VRKRGKGLRRGMGDVRRSLFSREGSVNHGSGAEVVARQGLGDPSGSFGMMDLRLSLSEMRPQTSAGGLEDIGLMDGSFRVSGERNSTTKSRVRKMYSSRSSEFKDEQIVGRQKLRGPSGAHLSGQEQEKSILLLDVESGGNVAARPPPPPFGATQNIWERESFPSQPSLSNGIDNDVNRRPQYWTLEEDEILNKAVAEFGEKNWKSIAEAVPGRTSTQCIQRWKKVLKPGLKKGHWSPEEDAMLVQSVQAQLSQNVKRVNWSEVCKSIPKRSCKQCRERWVNHLNPDVNKGEWEPYEDAKLWDIQELTPRKWAQIARQIPGRTENMVKVRWNILKRAYDKDGFVPGSGKLSGKPSNSSRSKGKRNHEGLRRPQPVGIVKNESKDGTSPPGNPVANSQPAMVPALSTWHSQPVMPSGNLWAQGMPITTEFDPSQIAPPHAQTAPSSEEPRPDAADGELDGINFLDFDDIARSAATTLIGNPQTDTATSSLIPPFGGHERSDVPVEVQTTFVPEGAYHAGRSPVSIRQFHSEPTGSNSFRDSFREKVVLEAPSDMESRFDDFIDEDLSNNLKALYKGN